jgi:nucleoside-diphosphate-sugar epimerase
LVVSSDQQIILITGVSGLIGRLLFRHLPENYPEKYHIIGLDKHLNLSPRYYLENRENVHDEKLLSFPADRFFQCDITDRDGLHHGTKDSNSHPSGSRLGK